MEHGFKVNYGESAQTKSGSMEAHNQDEDEEEKSI